MTPSQAASLMGRKSAEARKQKWGKKEFVRKMQEWGKLGGRPKGSSNTRERSEPSMRKLKRETVSRR